MSRARIFAGVPSEGVLRVVVLAERGLHLRQLQLLDRQIPDRPLVPMALARPPAISPEITRELERYGIEVLHGRHDTGQQLGPGTPLWIQAVDAQGEELHRIAVDVPSLRLPSSGLSFFAASCFYKDFHQAANYHAALQLTPLGTASFKLLLGDNLYLDTAHSEPGLDTGPVETVYRYVDYYWNDFYGETLSHLPSLCTFDDHEFWNNYPEESCWLDRSKGRLRQGYMTAALECIDLFQTALNPQNRAANDPRSFGTKLWGIPFYFLDMRTQRELRQNSSSRMFPVEVMNEFRIWATTISSPSVLVLGQPLLQGLGSSTDWLPADFAEQYAAMWKILDEAPHDILMISGDVHHSRICEITLKNRSVFEIVTSAASHIPSISSIIAGSFNRQATSAVEMPSRAPLLSGLGFVPRLHRYLMGTSAPNTVAQLRFTPGGQGQIDVGVALIDIAASGGPAFASSSSAKVDGNRIAPEISSGLAESLFQLR